MVLHAFGLELAASIGRNELPVITEDISMLEVQLKLVTIKS